MKILSESMSLTSLIIEHALPGIGFISVGGTVSSCDLVTSQEAFFGSPH